MKHLPQLPRLEHSQLTLMDISADETSACHNSLFNCTHGVAFRPEFRQVVYEGIKTNTPAFGLYSSGLSPKQFAKHNTLNISEYFTVLKSQLMENWSSIE